ncbi:SAM-dependent methyltransferase [Virgisporangium aurantiacum]|uniref:Tuberculostearic acid methyltransferase UfaA1 n=1 Tax=Virgisporangium aurantiacum TaxID=175570 RepID=A0A8J4DZV7_9ACTN|nr:cyclopropane-fatty-acyl-phospholipid synthase family protein [Virgisporangium aurantiacum]GIJ57130.1 tuberculostearic acid methyltransferase UfaA1 [Virgisporangium aurantiacum]
MTTNENRAAAPPVDPCRWPDLADVPCAPVRGALTAAVVRPMARRLGVRVELPDGRVVGYPDPQAPVMRLHRPDAVNRRFGARGPVGLGESYQAGEWDADNLPRLLCTVALRLEPMLGGPLGRLRRLPGRRLAVTTVPAGARRDVQHHYDLSNDLFALFLDETMTYSGALFDTDADGRPVASQALLAPAQRRKMDEILDRSGVGPETRMLETGTGWGELAITAARRGAFVDTVTLSRAQYELARRRVADAGVADRVSVRYGDYRDVEPAPAGGYDAIVSVEMVEAVGERNWPEYFGFLDRLLAPGGRVGLQTITMSHRMFLATRGVRTWILEYIFPGGLIPSVRAIEEVCRAHTTLRIRYLNAFGPHYTETLRLWRERFDRHRADVVALGFDETFLRTWHLYLSYCEAGFAAGYLDVNQLVLERAS